jgi:glycosyltransferase involved in cell wall biosynthesis
MRVLLVSDQYPPMVGGVPTVTHRLAIDLVRRGHRVWVAAPSAHGRAEHGSVDGVQVHRFASFGWPLYQDHRVALFAFQTMHKLLGEADPDVVHIHSPLALGRVAQRAARNLGKPVIATHHYLPENISWPLRSNARFSAAVYAYLTCFYNRCTLVTAPTVTALRLLQLHGLLIPARVVSNGVDLHTCTSAWPDPTIRRRLNLPADRELVLHVNRLWPEKRVDVLLEAAAQLHSNTHIALVGAGPAEAALRTKARQLHLEERVSFLGLLADADVQALRRSAAVCVIPSEAELQSLSTMEAMACGLPIVAADACALPELVHHGENGFLFEPGNSATLAQCLDLLLDDARLRARAGALSLKLIARHDRANVLDQWEALYARLAAEALCRRSLRAAIPRAPAAPSPSTQHT